MNFSDKWGWYNCLHVVAGNDIRLQDIWLEESISRFLYNLSYLLDKSANNNQR